MRKRLLIPLLLPTLALALGCDEDKRLVQLAQEADRRQAEQNHEMARQNRQIAEATRQLVEADAKARQDLVGLERDLQAEKAAVGHQRDELEMERRQMARHRQWDSLLASAVKNSGLLVVCSLPLLLCWFLLRDLRAGNDEAFGELLAIELTAEEPSLLLPSNAAQSPSDRLLPNEAAGPAIANGEDNGDLPF
jgi:hypothetical protein